MSDPVADLKRELMSAAERRDAVVVAGSRHRPRFRALLLAATLVITVAITLLVTSPWSTSPGFLQRADAALAQSAGVLHMKWEVTSAPVGKACVTQGVNEIWIDESPPFTYRAVLDDYPPSDDCSPGTRTELGGTFEPLNTIVFEPPGTFRAASLLLNLPPDPVQVFREAIARGTARDEGDVQLDGRTLRRIWLDPCPEVGPCDREASYMYVDPSTFYPVELRGPGWLDKSKIADLTFKYRVYEYLPRSDANLALTDLRAQHPGAIGP